MFIFRTYKIENTSLQPEFDSKIGIQIVIKIC